jgi:phosphoglycolate phosphatase
MVRQPYAAKERAVGVDLVVFDWDGTLIDSTTRIAESLHRAAQDTGLPLLSLGRYRSIIGLGLPEALHSLYPDADEQTRHVLRGHYAAHYIAATEADPCLPYDGAVELLENLRDRGIRLAVATGKNRPGLERAFAHSGLAEFFVSSRTADETASKPDPRMLLELLREQGVLSQRSIMVGDTGFDLEMARRARVPAIGVTHGAHDADELMRHDPIALVDHLLHILDVVDKRVSQATRIPIGDLT